VACNPPIGSIYHLHTTYILPSEGLYATYHLLREPETTIENICFSKCSTCSHCLDVLPGVLAAAVQRQSGSTGPENGCRGRTLSVLHVRKGELILGCPRKLVKNMSKWMSQRVITCYNLEPQYECIVYTPCISRL